MAGPANDATGTLLLTRREVEALMSPQDYFDAVMDGFAALGTGRAHAPAPLHLGVDQGNFHAKAAYYRAVRSFVVLKFNANMPSNLERHGMPTIQGAILLCDGNNGRLLTVLDSIEVTLRRTAAATALAARYLARSDSSVLALCGCGAQALPQIEALLLVLPVRQILLWDCNRAASRSLKERLSSRHGLDVQVAPRLADATRCSDIVVTCTTSCSAFLGPDDVKPGTFIAAVGADSPGKSELKPSLMAKSKVVVDSLSQCAEMGDLHHAVEAGAMRLDQVHAELSDLVCGVRAGRTNAREICTFDSTGVAVQDAASAARAFERASERGIGTRIELGRERAGQLSNAALLQ
jgi:ornithine cyclodeaminase/alanine dehydrogenase-like protein (mu-crystallin family)